MELKKITNERPGAASPREKGYEMGKAFFTVFYDTPHGYDWDESFDILVRAYRFYMKVDAPFKKLVMTDREHGDRTILSSKGEDNIDALGLRNMIW